VRRALIAGALLVLLGACGGDDGPVAPVAGRLEDLRSATMDVQLISTTSSGTAKLGFEVRGPFSFSEDHELPVFDLTTTEIVGGDTVERRVVSTGDRAYIVSGAGADELSADERAALRQPGGTSGGVSGLNLTDWIEDPTATTKDNVERITGKADVVVVVRDLISLSQGFGVDGRAVLPQIGESESDDLRAATRRATVELESDADDHDLHHLEVVLEFAADAPGGAKGPLASFAGITVTLRLDLDGNGEPVRVTAPA
jgi:hypothetical protein